MRFLDYFISESEQELFDTAVLKLAAQNKKSLTDNPTVQRRVPCYVAPDGSRCAIGHLLTDEGVKQLENLACLRYSTLGRELGKHLCTQGLLEFLVKLQEAHDLNYERLHLREDLRRLATKYGLDTEVLEATMSDKWLADASSWTQEPIFRQPPKPAGK